MPATAQPRATRFRTIPVHSQPQGVDHENRVIMGFVVARKGVTRDGRAEFDDTTLDQLVAIGARHSAREGKNPGLKSNFTHEDASHDSLGWHLGRARNFRRSGDEVLADLHLSPLADQSPHTTRPMGTYVLNLADVKRGGDPESFGASVDGTGGMTLIDQGTDPLSGEPIPPLARFDDLLSVDIVGSPAATEALFSLQTGQIDRVPAAEVSRILNRIFDGLGPDEVFNRGVSYLTRHVLNRFPSLKLATPEVVMNVDQSGTTARFNFQAPAAAAPPVVNPPATAAPAAAVPQPGAPQTGVPQPGAPQPGVPLATAPAAAQPQAAVATPATFAEQHYATLIASGVPVDQALRLAGIAAADAPQFAHMQFAAAPAQFGNPAAVGGVGEQFGDRYRTEVMAMCRMAGRTDAFNYLVSQQFSLEHAQAFLMNLMGAVTPQVPQTFAKVPPGAGAASEAAAVAARQIAAVGGAAGDAASDQVDPEVARRFSYAQPFARLLAQLGSSPEKFASNDALSRMDAPEPLAVRRARGEVIETTAAARNGAATAPSAN